MTEKRTKHESASSRSVRAARYPLPIRARVSSPFGAGLVIAGRQPFSRFIYFLEHAKQLFQLLLIDNKSLDVVELHNSFSDSALTR